MRLFSKRANWQECSTISDCTTGQYERYGIYNKNALLPWKYHVGFDPVFLNWEINKYLYFCVVRQDGRDGGGKILIAKIR